MTLLLIVATAADQCSAGAGAAEPADGTAAGAGSAAAAPSVAAAEGAGFPPRRRARECKMRSPYFVDFYSFTLSTTFAKQLVGRKTQHVRRFFVFWVTVFPPCLVFGFGLWDSCVCVRVRTHR